MQGYSGQTKVSAGTRLLIVDDDPFYRDMAASSLAGAGYEVFQAGDGLQGLELLRSMPLDMAVIDLTMPGMDGFEVIRRTRAEGLNATLPLIVITGQDDVGSVEQAFEAGATSFVAKPINWPLFVHHVHFVNRAARAEIDLRDAIRTAEFLSNLKSKVLSVLVSESQQPMRTAQGMAELLRKEVYGPLGQRIYQDYAQDLHRALEQLAATQLKMLNAGRALASELLLQEEIVPLSHIVREVIDSMREKADRRAIDIDARIAIPEEKLLRCDRALMNQALKMMLESAIAYAPRRSTISIDARLDASGAFSFVVGDDGPSLPDSMIREILNAAPARAGDASAVSAARNTSLTISRVLAEAHQGRLAINSTSGEGTMVRLLVPESRLALIGERKAGERGEVRSSAPVAVAAGTDQGAQQPPALRVSTTSATKLFGR